MDPSLKNLQGRFENYTFAKSKFNTCNPITNKHMLQKIKELSELFSFLLENIETFRSANILKKTEEERKSQEKNFHSTMCTFQMEKINSFNCIWCVEPLRDEAELMK